MEESKMITMSEEELKSSIQNTMTLTFSKAYNEGLSASIYVLEKMKSKMANFAVMQNLKMAIELINKLYQEETNSIETNTLQNDSE